MPDGPSLRADPPHRGRPSTPEQTPGNSPSWWSPVPALPCAEALLLTLLLHPGMEDPFESFHFSTNCRLSSPGRIHDQISLDRANTAHLQNLNKNIPSILYLEEASSSLEEALLFVGGAAGAF